MTSRSSISWLGAPLVAFFLTIWPLVSPVQAIEDAGKVGVVSFGLFGDQGVFQSEATGAARVVAGRFGTGQVTRREAAPDEIIAVVRDEMLPLEKNYWRTGPGMAASLARFESTWHHVADGLGWVARDNAKLTARDRLRTREAVSLLAAGRWVYASALARTESRGLHRRTDFPHYSPEFDGQHLLSGGLDQVWVRKDPHVNTLSERTRVA